MTRRRIQASPPPISEGEAANLRSLSEPRTLVQPPTPACGDCGMCSLCDAVLAYEDDALAPRTSAQPHDAVAAPQAAAPLAAASASAALMLEERGVSLYRAEHLALLEVARAAGGVDALIVDAPYSSRTHEANDGSAGRDPRSMPDPKKRNRPLDYACWSEADALAFVEAWAPLTRGWFVTITDHTLAVAWSAALEAAGRYVFAPIAFVAPGSRIRLLGDGPSNWTTWCVVSRPRTREFSTWGTLPGAYVLPSGTAERMAVVGGKPVWLMRELVKHYSRRNDLIADPVCGGGSLGVACIAEGRRALLGDRDAAHVEIARKRLLSCPGEQRRLTLDVDAPVMTQASLLEPA